MKKINTDKEKILINFVNCSEKDFYYEVNFNTENFRSEFSKLFLLNLNITNINCDFIASTKQQTDKYKIHITISIASHKDLEIIKSGENSTATFRAGIKKSIDLITELNKQIHSHNSQ